MAAADPSVAGEPVVVDAADRKLLRLTTAGSVDDGKSTLIGRLLLDTQLLLSDHLEDVSRGGEAPDLAALTDGLRAEREQGITIDVAYRFFQTPRRSFILADTPGHERYTRNMFTGASTAHAAIVLIDARAGVVLQTRRHTQISALLGLKHVVVCVNKMDTVDWDEDRFDAVDREIRALTERLGITDTAVIPISALHGDNVVTRSEHTPWYDGPALLDHLEGIDLAADRRLEKLRLPVQWVARPDGDRRRTYAGQVAGGSVRAGDEVVVLPAGARTTVTALDTLDPDVDVATPLLSVSVQLADDIDVGRGDVLVSPGDELPAARELDATICWMAEEPLKEGRRYALKHTSRSTRATIQQVHERTDPETLEPESEPAGLELNDIGRVTIRTSSEILAEPYADNRVTGAFILIDEHTNDTVAAGLITAAREVEIESQARRDVKWHPSALDREERWNATGQRGATVWLTGLPASGKSTIAVALEAALVDSGQTAYLLDGDNIRHGLSDDLGFAPGDRAENIRRVGEVTRLFADAGVVAVVSLVSPLAEDRSLVRRLHEAAGLRMLEIHVSTSPEECARRDPKGLYARAKAGEIKNFTGVNSPYQPPKDPAYRVDTAETSTEEAVEHILGLLRDVGG